MYNIIASPASYPNKYCTLEAVFVKRHLELIAEDNNVVVAFAKGDDSEMANYDLVVTRENGITLVICYFKLSTNLRLKNYINLYHFLVAQFKAIRYSQTLLGKVDFFHVHILTRAGVIPYFYSFFKKIPYFISEHSTLYLKKNKGFIWSLKRKIQEIIANRSVGISAVSNSLCEAIKDNGLNNKNFKVIPNFIDNEHYFPKVIKERDGKIKFLHVSRLDQKSKNILGIVDTFFKLLLNYNNIELHIVGGYEQDIKPIEKYIESLNCGMESVFFYGYLNKTELREIYRSADFLVMFSNYETQAIVILEALMCGVPVISTRLPALIEYLHEKNSMLVNPNNQNELYNSLELCIKGKYTFASKEEISNSIKHHFNKTNIIKAFKQFYNDGI